MTVEKAALDICREGMSGLPGPVLAVNCAPEGPIWATRREKYAGVTRRTATEATGIMRHLRGVSNIKFVKTVGQLLVPELAVGEPDLAKVVPEQAVDASVQRQQDGVRWLSVQVGLTIGCWMCRG